MLFMRVGCNMHINIYATAAAAILSPTILLPGSPHLPPAAQPVLRLWDGACLLFNGKPKPSGWVGLMLKLAKLFTPQAREAAAAAEEPRSEPMRKAQGLWTALKPVALRPLFESADVGQGEGRAIKRPRR